MDATLGTGITGIPVPRVASITTSVAEETDYSVAMSEIPKIGFVASMPMTLKNIQ